MNEVQLYINGQRADLFSDENISITSSIQNSTDISKIFTDFSQQFTIPASKTNNKIFKHYYNADIAAGYNFDARQKVDAIIELNFAHFRKGKLRLDGVQLQEGKPYAYRVTFFGSTVTLPDLMGEDLLSDLDYLDTYDHDYNESEVLTGLQSSLVSGNIIYPLISHTNRLYYDSGSTLSTGGNLSYNAAYPNRGVNYTDLKPAIKISAIIAAIEDKYNLTFDSQFLDGTLSGYEDIIPNLFMWLHAKKGAMQTAEGEITLSLIKNFLPASGSLLINFNIDGSIMYLEPYITVGETRDYTIALTITPVESGKYTVYIYKNNVLLAIHTNQTGVFVSPDYDIAGNDTAEMSVKIETEGGITNYEAEWNVEEYIFDPFTGRTAPQIGTFEATSQSIITSISIRDNIPNIKVIDFISNLFKMFNLTAYVKQKGQIYVEPLDTFYSQGNTIDISKHIENSATDINRAIPYKNIRFEYPESKTFFAEKRNQIFGGTPFGSMVSQQTKFDGGDYSLKVDFEKMLFERMTDIDTNTLTEIGWGWSVDYKGDSIGDIDKASSVVGKPLLFFNVLTTNSGSPISFYGAGHNSLTGYNRPSNVNSADSQTLNFNAEIDEYELTVNNNSIYSRFYSTYMNQVFNSKARKYSFSAKLPNKLLLNYSINDTFIIGDREYIINSIQTNAGSGDSKLELINKLF
jgi:hypothetical protein